MEVLNREERIGSTLSSTDILLSVFVVEHFTAFFTTRWLMANSIGYEANPIAFSTGNLYFDIAANALQVLAIWFFVLWAERKIGTKIIYGTIGLVVIAAIDMLNDLWVGGII